MEKFGQQISPMGNFFYHFTQLKSRDVWEEILDSLVMMERKKVKKKVPQVY